MLEFIEESDEEMQEVEDLKEAPPLQEQPATQPHTTVNLLLTPVEISSPKRDVVTP
jgi:hypothetical protein